MSEHVAKDSEVTGETITDEQIRELLATVRDIKDRAWCVAALRIPNGRTATAERQKARAHCASAYNARFHAPTRPEAAWNGSKP